MGYVAITISTAKLFHRRLSLQNFGWFSIRFDLNFLAVFVLFYVARVLSRLAVAARVRLHGNLLDLDLVGNLNLVGDLLVLRTILALVRLRMYGGLVHRDGRVWLLDVDLLRRRCVTFNRLTRTSQYDSNRHGNW